MSTDALLVPPGTVKKAMMGFKADAVENGVVVSKIYIVQAAGQNPVQQVMTYIYPSMADALDSLRKDV